MTWFKKLVLKKMFPAEYDRRKLREKMVKELLERIGEKTDDRSVFSRRILERNLNLIWK